jgi:hypothetical protein
MIIQPVVARGLEQAAFLLISGSDRHLHSTEGTIQAEKSCCIVIVGH